MKPVNSFFSLALSLFCLALLPHCIPSHAEVEEPSSTQLDPDYAAQLARTIREEVAAEVGAGLTLSLWAADTLLADPIALTMDEWGQAYVSRTNRQKNSEFDIRGHMDWVPASITWKTVEDRRAFLHEEFAPEKSEENDWLPDLNHDGSHDWKDLAVEQEEIIKISDLSGDGIADASHLFLKDFNEEITDCAGAILALNGELFVGVGPDLWRIKDRDGDGMADHKKSISHGYAVHVGFSGHGMSGLTQGPDGKIYWSIGDIGFNVVDQEGKHWEYPNQGAIVRSNPDGSDFEVYAAGLRNTHEFVFDDFGNIFSVDNDGDHPGESERLVYIVNGSDAGWRANWQYGKYTDPDNNSYKVWMDESLYKPRFEGQAAYIIPPIRNYHNGPTGMLHNPGTALGPKWKDKFFVVEFTGTPSRANVYAFRLKPNGAGYDFQDEEKILGNVLATGIDFGPDGALYIADWLEGWGTKNKGRIWKMDVPGQAQSPIRVETQRLIQSNFSKNSPEELVDLLHHEDRRIRLKAQFALAEFGPLGHNRFVETLENSPSQLARIHAVWGIGQLARKKITHGESLLPTLTDQDPELRAQAAKILGDVRYTLAGEELVPLLKDTSPRVRFFAAEALGRISYTPAIEPILDMIEVNNDRDIYLRHAGVLALTRMGETAPLIALASDTHPAKRLAAVLALRRLREPGIRNFLQDSDPYILLEVARAINDDLSIPEALPDLARLLSHTTLTDEALIRRIINANLRVGQLENLERLAEYATRPAAPEAMRVEALACLGVWAKPSPLDRVDGRHREEIQRDPQPAREVLAAMLPRLWATRSAKVRQETTDVVARLAIKTSADSLLALLTDDPVAEVRAAAFSALSRLEVPQLRAALPLALVDPDEQVRMTALEQIPNLEVPLERTLPLLQDIVANKDQGEAQTALTVLGKLDHPSSSAILQGFLTQLQRGNFDPTLQLDLIEAVEQHPRMDSVLVAFQAQLEQASPLGQYAAALEGGVSQRGARILYRNTAAQCMRCHAIRGRGGQVGPELTHIGSELSKEELLMSLVAPSSRIAPGYGTIALTLEGDQKVSGILEEESATFLTLKTSDAEPIRIPKSKVVKRTDAPSSMPSMGEILTLRELRDVVAYLERLK